MTSVLGQMDIYLTIVTNPDGYVFTHTSVSYLLLNKLVDSFFGETGTDSTKIDVQTPEQTHLPLRQPYTLNLEKEKYLEFAKWLTSWSPRVF